MKAEILKSLREIRELKSTVAKRIWENAPPVREIDEDHFDGRGDALTEATIKKRTEMFAEKLIQKYPNSNPVLISLMDGALPFASLLQNALIERGYEYDYTTMQASSYGNKMSSGELIIGSMPKIHLGGRIVFIVDDVCDTGKTYLKVRELLKTFGPEEISLIVLVDKVQKREKDYKPEFPLFELSSKDFIVGMGLDYMGKLRNMREIRAVDPKFLPTEKEQKLLDSEGAFQAELKRLIELEQTAKPGSSSDTLFGGILENSESKSLTNNFSQAETLIL
ncbi:phosphoribosyltransferase [Legionella hackeliae]|uniref:Putative Hypoxanthine phosphoribosyltransferase n=1 Tax=Legionella hackeliae TaxID=449 RepID=A0A0A8UND7_LEGHA|nr:phosphoribosyltransferase family protein [Legionella hackeliae]KTD14180.1 hypoxanthine-guanine phosphoribosyltransferase [Legionella hackeliae]CEK10390.1 putative Hypoxanthine phosphoribosyltransferase [Legionella hackeliae]STX47125.1 hypoxanthine phosphoribosyltransferase [Legionella hackeliae]